MVRSGAQVLQQAPAWSGEGMGGTDLPSVNVSSGVWRGVAGVRRLAGRRQRAAVHRDDSLGRSGRETEGGRHWLSSLSYFSSYRLS